MEAKAREAHGTLGTELESEASPADTVHEAPSSPADAPGSALSGQAEERRGPGGQMRLHRTPGRPRPETKPSPYAKAQKQPSGQTEAPSTARSAVPLETRGPLHQQQRPSTVTESSTEGSQAEPAGGPHQRALSCGPEWFEAVRRNAGHSHRGSTGPGKQT